MHRPQASSAGPIGGFLFDLDGVLVDSIPMHFEAYRFALRQWGVALDWPSFLDAIGGPARIALPAMLNEPEWSDWMADVHALKQQAFLEGLALRPPPELACCSILRAVSTTHPVGVVTSGNAEGATALLRSLGVLDLLSCLVTGDDVRNGKPDPEPYLTAASRLSLEPTRCVAFEDSTSGALSVTQAGMTLLRVTAAPSVPCSNGSAS